MKDWNHHNVACLLHYQKKHFIEEEMERHLSALDDEEQRYNKAYARERKRHREALMLIKEKHEEVEEQHMKQHKAAVKVIKEQFDVSLLQKVEAEQKKVANKMLTDV